MQRWALYLLTQRSEVVFPCPEYFSLFWQELMPDSLPSTQASRREFTTFQSASVMVAAHPWKGLSLYLVSPSKCCQWPWVLWEKSCLWYVNLQLLAWKCILLSIILLFSYFLHMWGRRLFPASRSHAWDAHCGHGGWYTPDHFISHWWVWFVRLKSSCPGPQKHELPSRSLVMCWSGGCSKGSLGKNQMLTYLKCCRTSLCVFPWLQSWFFITPE